MRRKPQAHFPHLLLQSGGIKESVYHTIRNAILDGRLSAGIKLPSSRAFAEMMSISRNSVIAGYERLIDEGYLITKAGSGTYVATTLPDELVKLTSKTNYLNHPLYSAPNLNPMISHLTTLWKNSRPNTNQRQMFNIGIGCVDQFPHDLWGRLLGRVWRKSKQDIPYYNHPDGYPPLKKILVDYVHSTRGVNCRAEQIIIVNGTQQAINLTANVLLHKGNSVWLDDPGYDSARAILTASGAHISPVHSDDEGMDIEFAMQHYPNANLIYTAPSHQFPLGTTLSLARRLALLEWAQKNNAWIFEDDYNSEFRYLSKPIQALQGLDTYQRVIYAGTFSKMMYPGFRLGFLIVPEVLIEPFTMMKYYSDSHSGYLEQAALAQFIQEGHYARHVRKIRKICYSRQNALIDAINTYLPNIFEVQRTDSGIHAVCWLKAGINLQLILSACYQLGFGVQPLSRYCIKSRHNNGILFGYAAHTETDITNNIIELSNALRRLNVI
ncbi:PLP-dependent aminotransferase family protein [Providencia vermicola]|uniref:MocR-like pyridoxine biosynthesis transcription factor PdxR n=1 Tax=Providencia TaxID=586 RepID=UPI0013A79AE7|nr:MULTISPECIES: PLP-dependent aminotransferase family protein [Providencia]ELR5141749.1 PLP-dependent aminotransferase family protein [Providencia stuartii]QIC16119.1 PLP-dependent aminotransferase family protein [Providencia vermicola]WER20531.1 PLP-dependent aminotransferase family protein [Providencia stuartii]WER24649.1 PLP-dependent aminotransferase family protein [Providencia stuartii]WER28740.1 PLP-dependent aminotransferase family protein [Providencia stuartii]